MSEPADEIPEIELDDVLAPESEDQGFDIDLEEDDEGADDLDISFDDAAPKTTSEPTDEELIDLAFITLTEPVEGPSLPIGNQTEILVGTELDTWGFPAGPSICP